MFYASSQTLRSRRNAAGEVPRAGGSDQRPSAAQAHHLARVRSSSRRFVAGRGGPALASRTGPTLRLGHLPSLIGLAILLVIAAFTLLGCQTKTATPRPTDEEQQQRYAELPGLRRSASPWLQEEFARLRGEQVLPLQLEAGIKDSSNSVTTMLNPASATGSAKLQRPAVDHKALAAIYPSFSRKLLVDQLAAIFPQRELSLGPAETIKAHEILTRLSKERRQFEADLLRVDRFNVSYRDGLLTNVELVETVLVGCRLEILQAATLLADGNPALALESLALVRHVARLCGAEGHFAFRMAAVTIRQEMVPLICALHNHPQSSETLRRQLLESVAADAATWPDDATLWIGDRAIGLHTYELIRDGYFLSLLSERETAPLTQRNILNVTARAALKNVDQDEAYYLRTMRQVIESASLSYPQRIKLVKLIQAELSSQRETPEYPLVAGMILLNELEQGTQKQGEDRSLWLALLVGLQQASSASNDQPSVAEKISDPLTGEPFPLEVDEQWVRVKQVGNADAPKIALRRMPQVAQPVSVSNSRGGQ